ncbi:MAG: hypothetical protein ACOYMF_10750 [Bacteroidales bacterium]
MPRYNQQITFTLSAVYCLLSLLLPDIAFSQVIKYNEEVTVVAPYEPVIPEAFKINQNPKTGDSDFQIPKLNYSIQPKPLEIKLNMDPISPVKMVSEPLTKLYRNYLRVGMGTYTTPYAEFFANTIRSKDHSIGVHIKHLSSAGKLEGYAPSGSSSNEADINGKKITDTHTLAGNIFYQRYVVHHYGFKTADFDTLPDKKDLRQRFEIAGARAQYSSNYLRNDKLNHDLQLSYYHLNDHFDAKEDHFKFNVDIDKEFKFFDITDKQQAGLETSIGYFKQQDSGSRIESTLIGLKPFISTNFNEYSFYAGFNIHVAADTVTKMHIYPLAEVKLRIIPNALEAYAGISGNMNRQNYRDLSGENPFIASKLKMDYSYEKFKFYGGITSNIGRNLDFSAGVSTSDWENLPFFVNDTTSLLANKFNIEYDDGTMVRLTADASFRTSDKVKLTVHGAYQSYSLKHEIKAWHKPALNAGFTGRYNIEEKIVVTGDITWNGKSFARDLIPLSDRIHSQPFKAKELKGYTDLSLGMEYRYTKLLSAFLNFNNIGNVRYFHWNNYPSQRFNFMGGITFAF